MDKVKYNPLTGEFQMVPDGNTYTFRINEETFEVPIGLTWEEWVLTDERAKSLKLFPVLEHSAIMSNCVALTPMCFSRNIPYYAIVQPERYPIAGMQYVLPGSVEITDNKGLMRAVSTFNIGACNSILPGESFISGCTDPVMISGPVDPLQIYQGDMRTDAATAWLCRNASLSEHSEMTWHTPSINEWETLNLYRPTVSSNYVYFSTINLSLPFGLYMVADDPSLGVIIDSNFRGIIFSQVSPANPKLVRPFLTV